MTMADMTIPIFFHRPPPSSITLTTSPISINQPSIVEYESSPGRHPPLTSSNGTAFTPASSSSTQFPFSPRPPYNPQSDQRHSQPVLPPPSTPSNSLGNADTIKPTPRSLSTSTATPSSARSTPYTKPSPNTRRRLSLSRCSPALHHPTVRNIIVGSGSLRRSISLGHRSTGIASTQPHQQARSTSIGTQVTADTIKRESASVRDQLRDLAFGTHSHNHQTPQPIPPPPQIHINGLKQDDTMTTSADQIQGSSAQPQAAGAAVPVKVEEGQQAQQNGNGNAKSASNGEKKKDPYYGHEEVAKMSARFVSPDLEFIRGALADLVV